MWIRSLWFSFFVLIISPLLLPAADRSRLDPSREDFQRARTIIEAYRQDASQPAENSVVVVYFTAADKAPAKDYENRIRRILDTTATFYDSQLKSYGLSESPMRIRKDADGKHAIYLVVGKDNDSDYPKSSGQKIRNEALPVLKAAGVDADNHVLLIFCNLMDYDGKSIRHHSPYYGGGGLRSGTAWQCDSEILDPLRLTDRTPIRDGEYGNITIGKHNSIFIGGVIHELGHALSLPHCRERPDQKGFGTALMGSGNRTFGDELRGERRGTFLTPAHTLRLAAHPVFSSMTKGLQTKAQADFPELAITRDDRSIVVSGTIVASPPAHAVIAYYDPDGGDDYDAQTNVAIPNAEGRFEIKGPAITPGPKGTLRLVVCHANGDTTQTQHRYTLNQRGIPQLKSVQRRLAMRSVVAAINAGDRDAALQAYQKLDREYREYAQPLIQSGFGPSDPKQDLSQSPKDRDTVMLSDWKPNRYRVGWGGANFNRVYGPSPLIDVAGEYRAKGIYAHAPSSHVYELNGEWGRLRGSVGLQTGCYGKVQFEIVADGKRVWASQPIVDGVEESFDVNVSGVMTLELLVNDGGNGGSSDWGIWVAPRLSRSAD